jgi:predicted nucleic acid-binding protein
MPLPGGYLLDTNIIVHLIRQDALGQYLEATYGLLPPALPRPVCIVTVGELYALANKFAWGAAKRAALAALLGHFLRVDINDPLILTAYGDVDSWSLARGFKMGKNDIWIAATSCVKNTTILTTDKDFDHLHDPDSTRTWRVDREWVDPSSKLTP